MDIGWIFGDKSSLILLCKSPPPGLSLAWNVLQGADQTRLSVGQTFGSLSLIQRLPVPPATHYCGLSGLELGNICQQVKIKLFMIYYDNKDFCLVGRSLPLVSRILIISSLGM